MLLPQQLEKSEKAYEKAYLALKVNITMQGGKVIHDGWAYIGLNTNWEMGKHYTYTLDFSDGAGQDEEGNQLISGKEMVLKVKVTPWDAKAVDLPEKVISGTAKGAFTYKVGGYYGTKYTVNPDASGNWSIPVAKFDGINNMSEMFSNGISLTTLDLSGWNTSSVTSMKSMFYNCSSLTSLDLSGFNTNSVTSMNGMFFGCNSLTSLDLSGFNTSSVTDMYHMFSYCTNLTFLDLSHFDMSKVTDMNNMLQMFNGCTNLKKIRMVGCSEETINKIKSVMPSGCTIVTE